MGTHGHTGSPFPKSMASSEDMVPAKARSWLSWGAATEQKVLDERSPRHKQYRCGLGAGADARPRPPLREPAPRANRKVWLRLSVNSSQRLPCSLVTPGSLRTSSKGQWASGAEGTASRGRDRPGRAGRTAVLRRPLHG